MMRILASIVASAILCIPAILFVYLLHRPAAPSAPPSSVTVNYVPYPVPATSAAPTQPQTTTKREDRLPAPVPAAKPQPTAKGPAKPATKGTWKRVVIIDGRKCFQPKGGEITGKFCE